MQAWICDNPTGVDALQWISVVDRDPRPGEVRIKIAAASLNFPDLLIVQNKYQVKPPLPFVPGSEYAGWIDAVGAGVEKFKVGDKVAAFGGTGGFATHACVNAALVLPLPEGFALDDAAAFVLTYGTTYHALLDRAALKAGETVLILGAAGGVGTAAIQIAKAAGARVIAAASTDAKCEFCIRLGADATINYSTSDLREQLRSIAGGKGPDVVYDPVGGDMAQTVFRAIAWRGRYLVIGFAQGAIPALPINLALLKGASLVGVFWGEFARREPKANAKCLMELVQWYALGKIKPVIDRKLPMTELLQAFALLSSRTVRGKLVLTNE
ncbi:MAG: NADPH:quinone oxidoreductase family protein [Burkholderiaceae bacterium]